MFTIRMPRTFRVGDTADVRINQRPARLNWRDLDTLVIDGTDARRICVRRNVDDLVVFICEDADGSGYRIVDANPAGFIVAPKVRS